MTHDEIRAAIAAAPPLQALVPDTQALAEALSAGRTRRVTRLVTTRSVRALEGVLPRSRHALLEVLRLAETTEPTWLVPALTAAGVPAEDHAALAADLASAWSALNAYTDGGGIDVGSTAARTMLDIIAAAVPDTAAACAAVKTMGEAPDQIVEFDVRCAIYNDDGSLRV